MSVVEDDANRVGLDATDDGGLAGPLSAVKTASRYAPFTMGNGPLATDDCSSGAEGGYSVFDAIVHFEHCNKFSDI